MEIDATPGSVSSHARSLVEMVSAIALARGAIRPTVTPCARSALSNEAQSAVPSARIITLTVPS